jgi:hypothetical protein
MIGRAPDVTVVLVGSKPEAVGLPDALRETGIEASAYEHPAPPETREIQGLAKELLRLESVLGDHQPTAVLLLDAGDRALAAALVATKLLIPVAAVGDGGAGTTNAALLAQLVDRKLSADASEIRAWLEALPTLRGD